MTDHQLSTRDLAARTDHDEPDSSLETEQPAERATRAGDQDPGFQSSQAEASLTRDPDASQSPAGRSRHKNRLQREPHRRHHTAKGVASRVFVPLR
jgi:hypothetical protein